jgi:hypothetical protein
VAAKAEEVNSTITKVRAEAASKFNGFDWWSGGRRAAGAVFMEVFIEAGGWVSDRFVMTVKMGPR